MTTPSGAASAASARPRAATAGGSPSTPASAPATSASMTGGTSPAQRPAASTTASRASSSRGRTSVNVYAGLNKLMAITALTCAVNGAAAYTYVTSEATHVTSVVAEQQASLATIEARIDDATTHVDAARTTGDTSSVATPLADGATEITRSAARAAGSSAAFAPDVDAWSRLSGHYATYSGLLQQAAAAPDKAGSGRLTAAAEKYRTSTLGSDLTDLHRTYETRGAGAQNASLATTGFLGLTTLLSVGSLVAGSAWLARATKRVVNPGLAAATLLALGTSYLAVTSAGAASAPVSGVVTGPLVLLGGIASAGLAWAGVQQRRKEYR